MAVSPRVRERLSVVMVRVTLQDVSPKAMAMAVAIDTARYLIAFIRRCFWGSVNGFIVCLVLVYRLWVIGRPAGYGLWAIRTASQIEVQQVARSNIDHRRYTIKLECSS